MTVAENLLRLHHWQLDERRRYLTELESLAERLRADILRLSGEIDADAAMSEGSHPAGPGGLPFSRRLLERRKKLEHSVAEIEGQLVDARAAIVAAEHEVEIWELAAKQRANAADGAIARRPRRTRQMLHMSVLARRHGS